MLLWRSVIRIDFAESNDRATVVRAGHKRRRDWMQCDIEDCFMTAATRMHEFWEIPQVL
mgnify:FL=1